MRMQSLPKKKSSFARLTWFITALSLAMLTLLGAVVIERITQQTVLSTVSFLEQQVAALGDAYQLQIHNLRFMRESLHQVDATPELTLYDAMSELIRDDSAIFLNAEHYQNYVGTADNLFVFMNLVMNAAEHPPKQITISSRTWGEKHFIWPMNHIFALDFARSISKGLPPLLGGTGQESIGILPLLEVTQRPEEIKHYVIYGTLFSPNNPEESTGTIAYAYELGNLNFVLERSVEPFQGTAYILDGEGLILYDSQVQRQGQVFPDFGTLAQASEQLHRRGGKLYALVYLAAEKLWAMAEMDASLLYDQVFQYALLIVLVILSLGLLSVASTRQAVRRLSRRVNALQDVMLVAQTGDLTIRADGRPNDEIGSLARSCNDMIEKIQEFIEEKYLSEIRQQQTDIRLREAALRALQSQVDPHFLYNTLETIRMQAIVNEDHETAMLIEMLAKLFRARLQEGHITSLSGEVAMLRSLIEIMGARFDGELALQITLPPALEDAAILKDLIQPIVENAFVHGLYLCPKDMPKRLIIHAREEAGKLIIEVANSHVHQAVDLTPAIELGGLSPEGRKRVGLRNVHERIAMVYGPGYGVSFRNTSQDLLSVYITLKMADYRQLNAMARGEENHVPGTIGGR